MHGQQPDTLNINTNESEEYELIIIDPEFHSWYFREARPSSFYSPEYLKNWNEILVNQWNAAIPGPMRRGCNMSTYINYDPTVDYGLEINHQLFYYFRYFHERCRVFTNTPGRW